jgi:hypothetical protein
VATDGLIADYVEHCRQFNVTKRGNEVALGYFFKKVLPPSYPRVRRRQTTIEKTVDNGFVVRRDARVRFYGLPTLEECRDHWDKTFGASREGWPAPEELGPAERVSRQQQATPF